MPLSCSMLRWTLVLCIVATGCPNDPPKPDPPSQDGGPGDAGSVDATPPTVTGPATTTIAEDGTGTIPLTVGGVLNASPCDDWLSVTSSDLALLPAAGLRVSGSVPTCSVAVTPAANASGSASLVATVTEGALSAQLTVNVVVSAVNDPPVLQVNAGTYRLDEDTTNPAGHAFSLTDDGTISCADVTATALTTAIPLVSNLAITAGAAAGECVLTARLQANANGNGPIQLSVTDLGGATVQATVNLVVAAVNDPPTLTLDANLLEVVEDASDRAQLGFQVADIDGPADCSGTTATATGGATALVSSFDVAIAPAGGGACVLTVFFVPDASGEGPVNMVLSDAGGLTASASFTLRVLAMGEPPRFATTPPDIYTFEDAANPPTSSFTVLDPDGVVTCADVTAVDGFTPPHTTSITITDDGTGTCVMQVQLAPNTNGDDPILLTLTDDDGLTATTTVTLHVASVIDQPGLSLSATDVTTTEDVDPPAIPFTITDVERPGMTLGCTTAVTAEVQFGPSGLVASTAITDGAGPGECLLTIRLGANANGDATILLTVTDSTPRTRTGTVSLHVTPVPDGPIAVFDTNPVTTLEDTPLSFYFTIVDPDGDAVPGCVPGVTASADNAPAGLVASLDIADTAVPGTCELTITTSPNANGSGPITLTATGADSLQGVSSVTLDVTPVPDGPTISDTDDQFTNEDIPLTFSIVIGDVDLPITCDSTFLSGTGSGLGFAFSGTPEDCRVTITPSRNQNGTVAVEITVFDGTLGASDTFQLDITPVEDDMCLPENGNGGCEQRCLSSVQEVVSCGCFPGHALAGDGVSCDSQGAVTLLNVGLNRYFDVTSTGAAPRVLGLRVAGRPVDMEQVPGFNDVFTFTIHESPGTCLDGTTSSSCVDAYRLCADSFAGFRVRTAWSSERSGTPSAWDSPSCAWKVEDLGGGEVRLKNHAFQQSNPYVGYVVCAQASECGFTFDNDVSGNTIFRIELEQCVGGGAGCDANATCSNLPAGPSCACNAHYTGDGTSCTRIDACLAGNGGCAQLCTGTNDDDDAICACAPGFELASDLRGCNTIPELRLLNVGLERSLVLPATMQGQLFTTTGSHVHVDPLAGSTRAFTFTVNQPGSSYRLCTHNSGGFQAYPLQWRDGDARPTNWDTSVCGWFITDEGNGRVRLESMWVEEVAPYYGYLRCDNEYQCFFALEGDTSGNQLFKLDQDECAAGTDACDANALCSNSSTGFSCACGPGYSGDGVNCVLTDVCQINNGGCSQRCVGTAVDGSGICACYPGGVVSADGASCDPVAGGRLYSEAFSLFIALRTVGYTAPYRFIFDATGVDLTVQPAASGGADKVLDMEYRPGRCADGSTSAACTDTYRMCVQNEGGFRLKLLLKNAYFGTPADWDSPWCAWQLEDFGNNRVGLKNAQMQLYFPYIDYLQCTDPQDCRFTLDEERNAYTEFILDIDECAASTDTCDPNADCANTIGSFTCTCRNGFVAEGDRCLLVDACVVDNGGCGQLCLGTQQGEGVCGCFPGFSLGADGKSCVPAQRTRLFNEGVAYLDLATQGSPPYYVGLSAAGRSVAVEQVPGTHDRFTMTMAYSPGHCANGTTNVLCPDRYRLCAVNVGGVRMDPLVRDARFGDPPGWDGPACQWIFESTGPDDFRIRNVWLQQEPLFNHLDYLVCGGPNTCEFTLYDSTEGNTTFTLDVDTCADGSAGCHVNATCTDGLQNAVCTCDEGYAGDGLNCTLENVCVVRNGGCEQQCLGTNAGEAVCGCQPGFALDADGRSCVARPALRLFNVGIGKYLDANRQYGPGLFFSAEGHALRMEQTLDGPDTFTFTIDSTPGTCANGSQRERCPDSYRLCAQDYSGFRWKTELRNEFTGKPALWDDAACKWRVEDVGGGRVRLRNLWLQERHPYLGNLICSPGGSDCYFDYGTNTSPLATFAIYTDECSATAPVCNPNATCRNVAGADTCVCNERFTGDGTTCAPDDACVVNNGGCQQDCSDSGSSVTCGCWSGFTLATDGVSCEPWQNVRLVSSSLGLGARWDAQRGLGFEGSGRSLRVQTSPLATNAITLTFDVGTADEVRICAGRPSGLGWLPLRKTGTGAAPAGWDGVECAWLVERADADHVRLRSLWIEQEYPHVDYLECGASNCSFTFADEKTPATVFSFQGDRCVGDPCGANATCANTATSFTCTCNPGYGLQGQACVLVDACVVDNGGCAQRCTHSSGGAVCGCYPGFELDVDGQSCVPVGTIKLLNVGFGTFIDVADNDQLELLAGAGADVLVGSVAGKPNVYTFTVDYGVEYRLCAWDYSGFRATTLSRNPTDMPPAGWDDPPCQWRFVPAGGDRVRLVNEWLQDEHPYADFLQCVAPHDWHFTYDGSTAGNTVFVVDADECALGTDACSPNATCTNTIDGYSCACNPRFLGDGMTCTPQGPCVEDNGGCDQKCTEVSGSAVCGCYPGFTVGTDPTTCDAAGTVVLFNVGHGKSLNLETYGGDAPYAFKFAEQGRGVRMERATDGRHDTFTFTFDYTPGTCADGSTSTSCTDQYRLCAGNDSGFRWIETWHHAGVPLPATWNGPECTWIVEEGTGGNIHLRNLWATQTYSYVDYLNCRVPYDCHFTGDDSKPPTATFRVQTDICVGSGHMCQLPRACLNDASGYVCSACPDGYDTNGAYACTDRNECAWTMCGANAHCTNLPGSFKCECDDPLVGDGFTCVQPGQCATNNGGCAQLCSANTAGDAVCECYPGFTLAPDGKACTSVGNVNLGNVELGLWLTIDTQFAVPHRFEFRADPARVRMEQVAGARDAFTFTAQYTPGTCADGSTSENCVDQYRMCLLQESGFRMGRIWRGSAAAAPTDWNSAKCQWQVQRLGDGKVRLRNVFLQQAYPYTEYLECPTAESCYFNYDETGAGNTTFRVSPDGQDLCTGVVCTALDQCHAPGVCYPLSGLCSDPVLPVGTPCDDGNNSATGDTCSSGTCINGGDIDGDGVSNTVDVCIGDDATGDTDMDGRCNDSDNCISLSNVSQLDGDRDGIGTACDNCPTTPATSQADADNDGVGNPCDPDYRPPSPGPDPGQLNNGGNPSRPACGFTPVCPGAAGATRFNSYLFGCYADEPNGGANCLGDRWWHHLARRIYPAVLTTTTPGTVDGILNELAEPENNQPPVACTTSATCTAPAECLGGVCTMPAVRDFIDRLSASSEFLSCTGPNSYEQTWPAARVIPLDTGPCNVSDEYHRIYGYRVTNTTGAPMTIWVTKQRGDSGRWWTINPGEEIRFNVFGSALLFATTAEAYNVCEPGFMRKTVSSINLTSLTAGRTDSAYLRVAQTSPVELVRYTVDGGGSLVITRDRELTLDLHLYVYPNYFGVGTPPFPQYSTSDLEQLIVTLARNVNGFTPVKEGGLRVISPNRYPVLDCTP